MGTRGTLKVYLNDELKIRQYNQWDSYPTGQFADICRFFGTEWLVEELVYRLGMTRFYTKEEYDRAQMILEGKASFGEDEDGSMSRNTFPLRKMEDRQNACNIYMLRNRDYGADILLQICCLCRNMNEYPDVSYAIVDWRYAFDEDNKDVDAEEGNYVIRIYKSMNEDGEEEIHFKLSGDWHEIYREFEMDYIPFDDEIKAWENEGYENR